MSRPAVDARRDVQTLLQGNYTFTRIKLTKTVKAIFYSLGHVDSLNSTHFRLEKLHNIISFLATHYYKPGGGIIVAVNRVLEYYNDITPLTKISVLLLVPRPIFYACNFAFTIAYTIKTVLEPSNMYEITCGRF